MTAGPGNGTGRVVGTVPVKWFRFYSDALDDPKVQRLPGELFKVWVNLLCLANAGDERGMLPAREDIAFRLRLSESDTEAMLDELVERGLIDVDDDQLTPHNWDGRQAKSDNVTERVQRYRAKRNDVPAADADETLPKRSSNALDKKRVETDTDEEESKNSLAADAVAPRRQARSASLATRERNPTWDAVSQLCGEPATTDERADFGKTIKQLTEARASPEEIAAFGPWWWQAHPDAELTHRCLRHHWGRYRNAPQRPAQLSDIKNPHLRSIATVDLSDITAELEAKHDPRSHLPRQDHRPGELPATARRVGRGGEPSRPDVLPAPRRP